MLNVIDISLGIRGVWGEHFRVEPLIVADECICDRNYAVRTSAAFVEQFVMGSDVRLRVFMDALRASVLETVNGLVLIADHCHCGIPTDRVDEPLLSFI